MDEARLGDAAMYYTYNTRTKLYKMMYWILPVVSLILLCLLYLLAVASNPIILPSPELIIQRFISMVSKPIKGVSIWGHIGASLIRVLAGASIAWVFGILFGIMIGWNKTCDALFGSVFLMIRPIPPIAWIPLIVMSFGIGEFPKILLVFIGCFTTMVTNTYSGVKMVNKEIVNVGLIFGANQSQILRDIVIPTALPSIFTGIRSTIDNGWKIVLAAEMMGAATGIGALITRGWNELDMAMVLVCIIFIALTGAALSFLIQKIERVLTPWDR